MYVAEEILLRWLLNLPASARIQSVYRSTSTVRGRSYTYYKCKYFDEVSGVVRFVHIPKAKEEEALLLWKRIKERRSLASKVIREVGESISAEDLQRLLMRLRDEADRIKIASEKLSVKDLAIQHYEANREFVKEVRDLWESRGNKLSQLLFLLATVPTEAGKSLVVDQIKKRANDRRVKNLFTVLLRDLGLSVKGNPLSYLLSEEAEEALRSLG